MTNQTKIEVSTKTMIKFLLILVLFWFLYKIINILILLFIVLIFVLAVNPIVEYLEKIKLPRIISVIIVYMLLLALFCLGVYLIIPPLVVQVRSLAFNLPNYAKEFTPLYKFLVENSDWRSLLNDISSSLSKLSGGLYSATLGIFGGITTFITSLVLSFYLLVERKETEKFLVSVFPEKNRENYQKLWEKISFKLGGWFRGQVVISLIFGIAVGIALAIIGVPYALTLGVIAGVLEIVPIVGAIISGFLILLVSLLTGTWLHVLIVFIVFVILQQLENNILIPKIMQKAVGLSPVVIVIALLIGAKLAGIVGAIIAIPVAAALAVLVEEWVRIKNT